MVCMDSMHSRKKVAAKYPIVDRIAVQDLYGNHKTAHKTRSTNHMWKIRKSLPDLFRILRLKYEQDYEELNKINMTKFYRDTTPAYYMFHC